MLTLALVSAATFSITTATPNVLTKQNTQTSFVINNRGPETVNFAVSLPSSISDGTNSITINPQSSLSFSNIATGQSSTVSLNYIGETTNFKIGEFTSNMLVKAVDSANVSNNLSVSVPLTFKNTFCKYGDNGSSLSIAEIDLRNDDGDDDTEWRPLDSIKLDVKVENNGIDKISSVYVEIGLLDPNGKNIVGDLENLDSKRISLSSISEDKDKTATFTFNVPKDFDEKTYQLVVKAYSSGKEAAICTSFSSDLGSRYYENIDGTRETDENKQIVLTNIVTSPETTAQCGDKVQLTGEIVNIGDTDYQDQVKVTMLNKDLNINTEQVIRQDFDQGDSAQVDFTFDIPQNAKEKLYVLEFRTYYDYDAVYGVVSDRIFTKSITVKGNCYTAEQSKVQITAQLDPQTPNAVAGKQIIVNSRLVNPGTTATTYAVSVYGNTAWSNLVSVDPQSFTLNPGESRYVNIVLAVDAEAEGDKEFTIKAVYGNQTSEQKVALLVAKSQAESGAFVAHIKANWFIYVIVLVNLILIIAIILVIKRMVSGPKRREYA